MVIPPHYSPFYLSCLVTLTHAAVVYHHNVLSKVKEIQPWLVKSTVHLKTSFFSPLT